jgi:hypothetical protein
MANDGDEQQREEQRQQELDEIHRSFTAMGARMGSLFEPAQLDEPKDKPGFPAQPAALPAPAPAPAAAMRPRWWWAAALVLLFAVGTAFGWILPKGDGGSDSPPPTQPTAATRVQTSSPPATVIRTRISVPDVCLEAAKLADEVISRLNRNQRDNRLAEMLRDYTIASQACRREASP